MPRSTLKPFKFLTMEYRTRLLHKEVDGSGTEGVSLLDALRQAPTEGLDEYMTLPETILISIRTSWKKSYVSIPKKSQKKTIRNVLISRSIPWER